MAKTLLNGVNEVLKRVRLIAGDAAALTTLTDESRQNIIDITVQAWNEVIDELYSVSEMPKPNELGESTITLVTSDRDYALATDLKQIYFPLLDETNGRYIDEYRQGYLHLVNSQPFPSNENGLPQFACIRPSDGQLYLDRIPTANENGLIYKYRYDAEVVMTLLTDTVPFNDAVFRALVPAVAEIVNREHRKTFDSELFEGHLGRASRLLPKTQQRSSYLPMRAIVNSTDPFEDN